MSGGYWTNATSFAISVKYEGHLNVDERIVADLIDACQSVADAISALPPLSTYGDLY